MAIAYDANGANLGSSSSASFTFSFTVGSGSNRILWVGAGHATATEQITAITYNGVSLTKVGYAVNGTGAALWYLIAPATGANNLVFTALGGSIVFVSASSYSGAAQSGQPDASVVDTTHSASAGGDAAFTTAVTTVADNDWIIASSHGPAFETGSSSDCTIVADQDSHSAVLYHKGPVTPAGSSSITIDTGFSGGAPGPTVLAAFSPVASAVTGTASITQADQSISCAGTVLVQGAATPTQAGCTISATGTVLVQGSTSGTQASETISCAGTILVQGSCAQTQASGTCSATGTILVRAAFAQTQGDHTLTAVGFGAERTGDLSLTQADQTLVSLGSAEEQAAAPGVFRPSTQVAPGIFKSDL